MGDPEIEKDRVGGHGTKRGLKFRPGIRGHRLCCWKAGKSGASTPRLGWAGTSVAATTVKAGHGAEAR